MQLFSKATVAEGQTIKIAQVLTFWQYIFSMLRTSTLCCVIVCWTVFFPTSATISAFLQTSDGPMRNDTRTLYQHLLIQTTPDNRQLPACKVALCQDYLIFLIALSHRCTCPINLLLPAGCCRETDICNSWAPSVISFKETYLSYKILPLQPVPKQEQDQDGWITSKSNCSLSWFKASS